MRLRARDGMPLLHPERPDQPMLDVRVGGREAQRGFARAAEQQEGLLDRLLERAAEHELAGVSRLPGQREVLVAELRAPLQVVRREVVDQQEMRSALDLRRGDRHRRRRHARGRRGPRSALRRDEFGRELDALHAAAHARAEQPHEHEQDRRDEAEEQQESAQRLAALCRSMTVELARLRASLAASERNSSSWLR